MLLVVTIIDEPEIARNTLIFSPSLKKEFKINPPIFNTTLAIGIYGSKTPYGAHKVRILSCHLMIT